MHGAIFLVSRDRGWVKRSDLRSVPSMQDANHGHGDEGVVDFGADVDGPGGIRVSFFCGCYLIAPTVAKGKTRGFGIISDDEMGLCGGGICKAVDKCGVAFQGRDMLKSKDGCGFGILDGEGLARG